MLILFHGNTSVASAKVRLALAEKGLSFESRLFDLRSGAHRTPDYLAINPAGVVPTLIHDGFIVRESNVILEYVEETFPEPSLMPQAAAERALVRLLMREVDHLHDACSILSSAVKLAEMRSDCSSDAASVLSRISDPRKRERQERLLTLGFDAPDIRHALGAYRGFLDLAAQSLRRGHWLSGAGLGLADCAALPYVHRASCLGMDALWADATGVAEWFARMLARPSFHNGILSWAGASNPYRPCPELTCLARGA